MTDENTERDRYPHRPTGAKARAAARRGAARVIRGTERPTDRGTRDEDAVTRSDGAPVDGRTRVSVSTPTLAKTTYGE